MKLSLNWLQEFVNIAPPYGQIADRLTMAGLEVKKFELFPPTKDHLFEVEVTTNRPDWLSHLGVAREIAAVENLSLKMPSIDDGKNRKAVSGWKIEIRDLEACPYYTGVLIEGIGQGETPEFMRQRLSACGVRLISPLVDITNYVLLETGQPLHAFDADRLAGQEIKIRRAKDGEKLLLIDGRELELKAADLVIADRDKPVALAGVMGGKETEVTLQTRNVLLESAFFHPRWIRQAARRYGLSSESSYRFERRVDPEGVDLGRERALTLIQKYVKPRLIGQGIRKGDKPGMPRPVIQLQAIEIVKTLGIEIKEHQVHSILTRLGLGVQTASPKCWKVTVPSFREDLGKPIDLIEEIARIYGYENIPEHLPERAPSGGGDAPLFRFEERLAGIFSGLGFFELVTFSLISEKGLDKDKDLAGAVFVSNPQNKELCWMRPSFTTSHLEVIKRNNFHGNTDNFFFEIANLYQKGPHAKAPQEIKTLGVAMAGHWKPKSRSDAGRPVTYYDLKGVLESVLDRLGVGTWAWTRARIPAWCDPGICESLQIGERIVGFMGQVRPELEKHWGLESPVFVAEIALELLLDVLPRVKPFAEWPKFPSIERDISVTVRHEVKADQVIGVIRKLGKEMVRRVEIFDLFEGGRVPAGCKNLGLRVTYQSDERTLVSEEIQVLHDQIAATIVREFQAAFQ
ncbi:MAG: phenylalanine--tRNA ligase subunit beta [Candidatus Omnitrophota bacterium]